MALNCPALDGYIPHNVYGWIADNVILNPNNVLRLNHNLFHWVCVCVWGQGVSDLSREGVGWSASLDFSWQWGRCCFWNSEVSQIFISWWCNKSVSEIWRCLVSFCSHSETLSISFQLKCIKKTQPADKDIYVLVFLRSRFTFVSRFAVSCCT